MSTLRAKPKERSVCLQHTAFRLVIHPRTGSGELYHRMKGKPALRMGRVRYLAQMLDHKGVDRKGVPPIPMSMIRVARQQHGDRRCCEIELLAAKRMRCRLTLSYSTRSPELFIQVQAESIARKAQEMGLRAFCLDLACDTLRARLLPGLYSGWFCAGRSIIIYPVWVPGVERQMTSTCDFVSRRRGDIRARRQGVAFNLPPAMFNGAAVLDPGEIWRGAWVIRFGQDDIWDPQLKQTSELWMPAAEGIQPPRHSYSTHIANWETLMRRQDLWVRLGPEMGMYHRGYYGMIRFGQKRVSGTLRYHGLRCIGTGNERLIESAWGGSNNALLAYTLFHYGKEWARERALKIVAATLRFKTHGFQVCDGPCRGAWYNGYLVEPDRFADRYGRQTIYTPDQGIVNYFMGKLLLEKWVRDEPLVEKIRTNCFLYLRSLKNRKGGLAMARRLDGAPGVDRYELPYTGHKSDLAMPCAMGALSFLICFRLTGDTAAREEGEALLEHLLEKIAAREWRFHEYDTWGWDSMAMSWILVVLSEWWRDFPSAALETAMKDTFDALDSCRHRCEFGADRYSDLERCWGGRMVNRGGICSGTTVGSMQGGNSLHNRFDPALALWTHYCVTGSAPSYVALLEFLNFLTHHQWTRSDLPIGLGAVTEATHLDEGHIQDTAQTLHSNCLFHILLNRALFLESSTASVVHVELPRPNGADKALNFHLRSHRAGYQHLSIAGKGADRMVLRSGKKIVHVGSGREMMVRLDQPDASYPFTAEPIL